MEGHQHNYHVTPIDYYGPSYKINLDQLTVKLKNASWSNLMLLVGGLSHFLILCVTSEILHDLSFDFNLKNGLHLQLRT